MMLEKGGGAQRLVAHVRERRDFGGHLRCVTAGNQQHTAGLKTGAAGGIRGSGQRTSPSQTF